MSRKLGIGNRNRNHQRPRAIPDARLPIPDHWMRAARRPFA